MKKSFVTMGLVVALSMATSMTALAGWEQTGITWKYQTNGTYYNDGWHWIDGNGDYVAECYFFNVDSTMLSNTTTPDNFTVNADGAWTVNGIVQTKVLNDSTTSSGKREGTEVPQTEPPTQETQDNTSKYYKDDGTPDINSIVDGLLAGDSEASQIADGIDAGGGGYGNHDWN